MSKAARNKPHEESRGVLRDAGLRVTASRVAVMELMMQAETPMSHAEVIGALQPATFDRVTLYRNLLDLTDAGLLVRIALVDNVWRFEYRRYLDDLDSSHPHFVCTECRRIFCLDNDDVQLHASAETPPPWSKVSEILLKGCCADCAG